MLLLAGDKVENQSFLAVAFKYSVLFQETSPEPYKEFTPDVMSEYTGSFARPFCTVYKPRIIKSVTCSLLMFAVRRNWFPPPVILTSIFPKLFVALTRKSRLVSRFLRASCVYIPFTKPACAAALEACPVGKLFTSSSRLQ